jgi:hypothetical protein
MKVARHEVPGNALTNQPQFDPLTPCPAGRTHDLAIPGSSCQATFIVSLRDTAGFALGFFNSLLM